MKRLHLIIGVVVFIVFLVTGRFMRLDFPDKEVISQELRILMRSRHIYILFSAFLHLLLGFYLLINQQMWKKLLQISGSILLIFSSVFLIYGFVYETYSVKNFSEISRLGIYMSLGGIAFHLFGNFPTITNNER